MLFGSKKPQNKAAPSFDRERAMAILTPAAITMAADGHWDDSEIANLVLFTMRDPLFKGAPHEQVSEAIGSLMNALKERSHYDLLVAAAGKLDALEREAAMELAIRVAVADGKLDPREAEWLAGTGVSFGIEQSKFQQLFIAATRAA